MTDGSQIDRQTIVTADDDYDNRGNALKQTTFKEYYDVDEGFIFIESQEIKNDAYDFHDRSDRTVILTYSDRDRTDSGFLERQDIIYEKIIDTMDVYDKFGNVLQQKIIRSANKDGSDVLDYKEIINSYLEDDSIWALKGWVAGSTVTTYTEEGGDFVEKQLIEYAAGQNAEGVMVEAYDPWGNAQRQEITRFDSDEDDAAVLDHKVIINTYDDPTGFWKYKGLAATSNITTYTSKLDADSDHFVDSQEIVYNDYDAYGNSEDQDVITLDYDGNVLGVKNIVNLYEGAGYTSNGWVSTSYITSMARDGETVVDFQEIFYDDYDNIASMGYKRPYGNSNVLGDILEEYVNFMGPIVKFEDIPESFYEKWCDEGEELDKTTKSDIVCEYNHEHRNVSFYCQLCSFTRRLGPNFLFR